MLLVLALPFLGPVPPALGECVWKHLVLTGHREGGGRGEIGEDGSKT